MGTCRSGPRAAVEIAAVAAVAVFAATATGRAASNGEATEPDAGSAVERAEPPFPVESWNDPPLALRPVARWWWPGGSVDPGDLRSHLGRIRAAGFGAVEVQPLLLGLGASDLAADPRLRSVGTEPFRRSLRTAAEAAGELGLGFDLTLGSGWPGGLPTPKRNAERQLLLASVDVEGPARFDAPLAGAPDQSYRRAVEWLLDVLGPADPEAQLVAVLAARLAGSREGVPVVDDVRELSHPGADGQLLWDVPAGRWRIFAVYQNSTEHFVMGGAFPGEEADARVVDHLSVRGADALIEGYGAPALDAIGPGRVRELFVDSFELMGELPFTAELLVRFERQAGYSLTPHLPLIFRKGGESKYGDMLDVFGQNGGPRYVAREPGRAARIREDYERVRAALFEERFVARLQEWANGRGLALRLQAHGGYGDYLDVYARADVPESEGLFGGGSFDFLRLAASAAHVAGRRFASSEAFITLRPYGTRLSLEEMRLLAGRAYSAGINRLAFHGVPYPYQREDGVTWYPFSGGFGRILAGPLPMSSEIDAGFLAQLPDFNLFLSRLSVAMSHGEPVADVAWLRADPIYPDRASFQIGRITPHAGESAATGALRARGLSADRVSRRMLAGATSSAGECRIGEGRYRAIVLDPMEVAEPELVEAIAAIAEAGIPVLTLGRLPDRAPGLREAGVRDGRVRSAVARIGVSATPVRDASQLEGLLANEVSAGLVEPLPGERLSVSLERRRSAAGEILLVFNESWSAHSARLRFTQAGGVLASWDPRSGRETRLADRVSPGDVIAIELEAAETRIFTLERRREPAGGDR